MFFHKLVGLGTVSNVYIDCNWSVPYTDATRIELYCQPPFNQMLSLKYLGFTMKKTELRTIYNFSSKLASQNFERNF